MAGGVSQLGYKAFCKFLEANGLQPFAFFLLGVSPFSLAFNCKSHILGTQWLKTAA